MNENKVWKPVKQNDLPANKKLSTIWTMKKNANGKYRARITTRGFLQEDGVNYFSQNESTIKILLNFLILTT
jgi:hypothetical protein